MGELEEICWKDGIFVRILNSLPVHVYPLGAPMMVLGDAHPVSPDEFRTVIRAHALMCNLRPTAFAKSEARELISPYGIVTAIQLYHIESGVEDER